MFLLFGGFRRPVFSQPSRGERWYGEAVTDEVRAAQVCRPYGLERFPHSGRPQGSPLRRIWEQALLLCRGRTLAGPREEHTPGRLLSAFDRFTFSPFPRLGSQETLSELGRGGPWASRQNTHRERLLGQARRGCGTAPAAIFANPGPNGPGGITEVTQILRAGNVLPGPRGIPRNGGPGGRAAWRQGRQSRSCRLRPPLGGSLVTFWPSRKSLAAGCARRAALSAEMAAKLPCDKRRNAFIAPSSGPFRATYPLCRCATSSLDKGSRPPGGKAKKAGGKNST